MAKSVFTRSKLKVFFIFLLIFAVLSMGAAIGAYYYFGHSFDGKELEEGIGDKLKLGNSFTIDDIAEAEGYKYKWLTSGNVEIEIYSINKNNESEKTDEILTFNGDTKAFTVVGVSKGYIKFINNLDSTINLTVPFTSSFVSNDTETILAENYANYIEDEVVLASEISGVEVLRFEDKTTVDLADFGNFVNLKKIEIQNIPDAELISFNNFNLPEGTNIYVSAAKYIDYISRPETTWDAYKNKIFPASSFEQHSIVFYKNGGLFEDDNGLLFKAIAVDDGESLNLSSDYSISRVGYQFAGWFVSPDGVSMQGDALTDDYKFVADVKLCAKWVANTYTVRMYNNDNTQDYTDKLFTYDTESAIADVLPDYSGFIHLGWASDKDAKSIDFEKQQSVKNLTETNNDIIEVYAIWAYETFELQYYSWDSNKVYQKYGTAKICTYGDAIVLNDAGGPPSSPYGSFRGWALTPDAAKSNYNYGDTININIGNVFLTSKTTDGILKIYGIFELQSYDIIYDAAGGTSNPSGMNNVARGVSVNLNKPIEKEGYKFMGWKDSAGYIWTCEELYQSNQSFFNSNFTNRLKTVDLTEYGFVATEGINTVSATQVTLTAVWRANTFNVKFNGANANSIFADKTVTFGSDVSFTGETTRTGWSYSVMNSNTGNVQLSGRTLSANQVRTLYLALKGNSNNNDFNENSTVIFTPDWSVNSYTVSFNSNGGGSVSSKTVTYGDTYGSLPSTTRSNSGYCDKGCCYTYYTFSHWEYNGQAIDSSTIMNIASDHELKAVWSSGKVSKDHCLVSGTLIQMADGTQKKIEDVSVGDYVLTWDFETGTYTNTMVVVIEHDDISVYEVVDLTFDDGVTVSLITEHGFFDADLNKFVYITPENAHEFIGHKFIKMSYNGQELVYTEVSLSSVNISNKEIGAHSMVTANQLSHFANGYLSIAAGIDGLFNIFDITDDMKYDAEQMQLDIQTYGLYTYEDFVDYVSYEEYVAFNGAYLKIAVGKGLTTYDKIVEMINRYLR